MLALSPVQTLLKRQSKSVRKFSRRLAAAISFFLCFASINM